MLEDILITLCCFIAAAPILHGLKKYAVFSRMIKVFKRIPNFRSGSSMIPMTIETRPETVQTFVTTDDETERIADAPRIG